LAKKDRELVKQGLSDVLGPSGDLMGNIIDSDRRRAGRTKDVSASNSGDNKAQANTTSSIIAQTTRSRAVKTTGSKPPIAGDPMRQALLDLLAQPYSPDPKYTVTSVKIETEVLERLGWVSTLTGEAKQDVISSALKEYFQKVGR
jgi:hypothetical protein